MSVPCGKADMPPVLIFIRRCLVGVLVMMLLGGLSAIGFVIGASVVVCWYFVTEA
jgi:hypothetical protein